ncbi:transcription factor Opi1-domain-containing protein [Dactylonectria estremocensis]|uniref:Transcription factor Opi1-domain-containing protein n=1 Tax=Dactylonectria estremocensis TaxID=1079267 RepID=A0A9P9J606_9HYPO|nr:transcription factor Opi1-domain-containing protein [Dactylonectria estremocensis]
MERNHMLVPTRDRESASSHDAVLGPPPPLPTPHMMGFSPPAYSPSSHVVGPIFNMPDVPNTELPPPLLRQLPPLSHRDADIKLPSLSSLTGDLALGPPGSHWPHLNSLPPYHPSAAPQLSQSADSPIKMDMDTSSNSAASAASPDRFHDARSGSVSLDDPDVRLAAEALGDLRADFVSSPPNRNSSLPVSPPTSHGFQTSARTRTQSPQPEPLLSLLTTSHPLLASTIEGATSAYGGAKNFSPRFRSGAEYVEGYLTPIANTVGSVGRRTGVEGGVRWFLGAGRRQNSDLETGNGSKKRRKVDNSQSLSNKRVEGEGMKQIGGLQHLPSEIGAQQDPFSPSKMGSRRMSTTSTIDTLPAYDEIRSPAYTETADAENSPRPSNGPWQSRLIMSTSGLSIAMSDESLRSLKYCLRWLKWANSHMGRVIGSLKDTLEQFDKEEAIAAPHLQATEKDDAMGESSNNTTINDQESRREIAARIASLKGDVLKTLQEVIITVSKYAGGALPENARILVRRHLTSLPQRFRVATMSDNAAQGNDADSESALREGAQKVLVLAKEGLDMVAQVSGVLDGTIVSAEEWCERMGKRRRNQDEEKPVLPQTQTNNDVKMG